MVLDWCLIVITECVKPYEWQHHHKQSLHLLLGFSHPIFSALLSIFSEKITAGPLEWAAMKFY